MAPLVRLIALFTLALSSLALASPHISRHVHARHPIRPVLNQANARSAPITLPKRKRSLNKRCILPPSNGTASALPSSPSSPLNVAPLPSSSSPSSLPPSPTVSPGPDTTSIAPSASSYTPSPSSASSSASSYTPPSPSTSAPATTSEPPPPPSSSSTPTPTPTPTPSSTSTPPPAQTSSPSSDSGEPSFMYGTQHGQGTYYDTGLGACGITNNDSQNIVAVSHLLFDSYPGAGADPNSNPVCGKTITASYQGKSVTVTVTDRCTACQLTDLDFSPTAFDALADPSVGRIDIQWEWA